MPELFKLAPAEYRQEFHPSRIAASLLNRLYKLLTSFLRPRYADDCWQQNSHHYRLYHYVNATPTLIKSRTSFNFFGLKFDFM